MRIVKKFNDFARQFSVVAADRKVTDEERTDLLTTLGELPAIIRHDLASEEDRRTERKLFSEEDLKNLVMANVNSLFGKTTPKHFLDSCSTEARDYFSRLFARLDSEDIPYWMGTRDSIQTEGPPTGRDEHALGKDAVPVLARMYERRLRGYRAMGYEVG
jgi:hypothetical protein